MEYRIDRLPSLLAIPIADFARERHGVMRLHRACDVVEVLTRFGVIVMLGEYRREHGAYALPESLISLAQRQQIERPTFGQWLGLLREVLREPLDESRLVLSELPRYLRQDLLTLAPEQVADDVTSIVDLRNMIVHGGGISQKAAAHFLSHWEERIEKLLAGLSFLESCTICWVNQGKAFPMVGPHERLDPSSGMSLEAAQSLDDHVILLARQNNTTLDLWPLCNYGKASGSMPGGHVTAEEPSPLLFMRASQRSMQYLALGADLPFAYRADQALSDFRRLFQLDTRERPVSIDLDWDQEFRADAAALVGRTAELKQAKNLVKVKEQGLLWIGGPAGIGKSLLVARIASDLSNAPSKQRLCIFWRFLASDQNRFSRVAFLRHAVRRLAAWLGKDATSPEHEASRLLAQFRELLRQVESFSAPDAGSQTTSDARSTVGPRVLFVLDGLDELVRYDPDFLQLPLRNALPKVVWLCAGRPEPALRPLIESADCEHVYQHGLPAMSDDDIRGMLLHETANRKYDLLRLDQEVRVLAKEGQDGVQVVNPIVDAVVERAQGLPLYVHLVVQDVVNGQYTWDDLRRSLPGSLAAYYNEMLRRMGIGALQSLLTPLVVTLAWARAPLDEETLVRLMVRRGRLLDDRPASRELLRKALDALQGLIRATRTPQGTLAHELYHPTLREHILEDRDGLIGQENPMAHRSFWQLACDWRTLVADHPGRAYALRHGPRTLIEAAQWDDLENLLCDIFFLEEKAASGLVFELAEDFRLALAALPADRRRRFMLSLLLEALQLNIDFISRHASEYPQGLFQCLWNTCWWYDAPQAARHYGSPAGAAMPPDVRDRYSLNVGRVACVLGAVGTLALVPSSDFLQEWAFPTTLFIGLACFWTAFHAARWVLSRRGWKRPPPWRGQREKVSSLMETWRHQKEQATPGFEWVRSIWPPAVPVGTALKAVLHGHQFVVNAVAFSPDGSLVASGASDGTARVWDVASTKVLAIFGESRRDATEFERMVERRRKVDHGEPLGDIVGVAFSNDGLRLACRTGEGVVRAWHIESKTELAETWDVPHAATSVSSPDGKWTIAGWPGNDVELKDGGSGALCSVLGRHEDQVTCAAFSADGRRVVTGSRDKTVRIWAPEPSEQFAAPLIDRSVVGESFDFSPNGRLLAYAPTYPQCVRAWYLESQREHVILNGIAAEMFTHARFFPDSRRLLLADFDKVRIAVADRSITDNLLMLWESPPTVLPRPARRTTCMAISADGQRLLTGEDDGPIRLWSGSGKLLGELPLTLLETRLTAGSAAFSPDGRRCAVAAWIIVFVWDLAGTQAVRQFIPGSDDDLLVNANPVDGVAFSHDGRRILARSADRKRIYIWEIESAELLAVVEGTGDLDAVAAGHERRPYRLDSNADDTAWVHVTTNSTVAWYPEPLYHLAAHPSGSTWAGRSFHQATLHLLTLEGASRRPQAGALPPQVPNSGRRRSS